jgi:hypothetical protein
MDVVTAYLYESLDLDIYMEVPDGISVLNANVGHNMYCVEGSLQENWLVDAHF